MLHLKTLSSCNLNLYLQSAWVAAVCHHALAQTLLQ